MTLMSVYPGRWTEHPVYCDGTATTDSVLVISSLYLYNPCPHPRWPKKWSRAKRKAATARFRRGEERRLAGRRTLGRFKLSGETFTEAVDNI